MSETRVSDLAILLGHALQCEACRSRLLTETDRVLVGKKITTEQRASISRLTQEDFESSQALSLAVGLTVPELTDGINHPRARLRHF